MTLFVCVCLVQCQDGEKLERCRSYRHFPRLLQMGGQVSVLDRHGHYWGIVGFFEHLGNNSCFPVMWAAMRMLCRLGRLVWDSTELLMLILEWVVLEHLSGGSLRPTLPHSSLAWGLLRK